MTNTQLLPTMSFNMSNLDLEWFYGPEPQQSKYAHELLRAETLGRQAGCVPLAIAAVHDTKNKQEEAFVYRTRFGTLMVHEIRPFMGEMGQSPLGKVLLGFGYGADDCRVMNYWQEDYPVKVSQGQVKSLLMRRGNELLLMLVTWNAAAETVSVAIDEKALGLRLSEAMDAETLAPITLSGGRFTLTMEGYGVRVVKVK
jgi:hypothetical protein